MITATTQFALNREGKETHLKVIATYGKFAVLESPLGRETWFRCTTPTNQETLFIDGEAYTKHIVNGHEN